MKNLIRLVRTLYAWFVKIVSSAQSPFLLVVRLYWGWQISQNGWAKLHNLPHVTEFFASLGLPAPGPTAIFVSSTESVVGILLALGLLSRVAALALTVDMTMAYVTADRAALLSFFSDPGKFYNADPYTFLFAALLILTFGPGKISLDALLERYFEEPHTGRAGRSGS
jgi:putative oxidoreductase